MKVKELIEQLQKQNPEDEVHIFYPSKDIFDDDIISRQITSDIKIDKCDLYYDYRFGFPTIIKGVFIKIANIE